MKVQSSPTPPHPRRLRILCLHGYRGSGAILRRQLGTWPEELAPLADFVCVDAPSLEAGGFGWWHAVDMEEGNRRYEGWPRTRAAVVSTFESQGPFDGILGFSQGAALAALLVDLRALDRDPSCGLAGPLPRRTPEFPLCFGFAILVSGFGSNDRELARLYERSDAYDLPSLHLIGRADTIVRSEGSHKLASHFRSPVIVEHAGGHVIPGGPDIVAHVRTFLEALVR
jgi:predicted esterase